MTPNAPARAQISTNEVVEELLNMAVGRAAAETEDLFRFTLSLSVPESFDTASHGVGEILSRRFSPGDTMWMIEQEFYGDIEGTSYLVGVPLELSRATRLFDHPAARITPHDHADALMRHATLELGSVLMASCIGAFAELAERVVTFGMPRFIESVAPWNGTPEAWPAMSHAMLVTTSLTVDRQPIEIGLSMILPVHIADEITGALAATHEH